MLEASTAPFPALSQCLSARSNINVLHLLLGISTSSQGCHFLRWILKGHLRNVVSFGSCSRELQSSEPTGAAAQPPFLLNQDLANSQNIPAWAAESELRCAGDQRFSAVAPSQAAVHFKGPEIPSSPSASNFQRWALHPAKMLQSFGMTSIYTFSAPLTWFKWINWMWMTQKSTMFDMKSVDSCWFD